VGYASNYSNLFRIEEVNTSVGVEQVINPSSERTVIYDLSGRRVKVPTNGIYIINGKKVYVK
jgi:hypothetical protein